MSDQFWLTKAQLKRIEPFFPRTRGIPRVDDRRVVSGIVHVIRNGLRWRDAPAVYGPHKTLQSSSASRFTAGAFAFFISPKNSTITVTRSRSISSGTIS
jgi:putative transposase